MKPRTVRSADNINDGSVPRRNVRSTASPGRVFRFAYYVPPKENDVDLPELRDSDAFVELSPLLYPAYSYGGLVLNYPAIKDHDPNVIIPVDEGFLTPSDLLVLSTRPPLNDHSEMQKKYIRRSFTSLEHKVLKAVGPYLPTCSRQFVELSRRLRDAFPEETAKRAHVEYRINGRFPSYKRLRNYKRHRWDDGDDTKTGAYLIYKKPAWPKGPALLVAFGMNKTQTLLWNHFLATRREFSKILTHPRFIMAEIDIQDIPKRPGNLWFSDSWSVTTLLDHPLDQPEDARG